ncbi:MAG: hypothetical protein KGM99_10475 [Burkholderiales bacterium]|nr:hypothetical protein [Burkholderiales bacterium]
MFAEIQIVIIVPDGLNFLHRLSWIQKMSSQWLFPTPYCLFVRLSVRRERYIQFKELASKVAFAYQQHSRRMRWMAYATVAGPANYVYIMLPLAELGDMDHMPSLDQVLADVYGPESMPLLERFQDCVLQMETFVLNRVNDGINPIEREQPPAYLYYLNLQAQPGRMGQLMQNLQQLGLATSGSPLFCFATFAGPVRLHAFTMGNTIAELGEVASLERRVVNHFGAESGHKVISEIHDTLTDIDASILRYIGHLN